MSFVRDVERLRAIKGKKITSHAAMHIAIHGRTSFQACIGGYGTPDNSMTVSVILAWMWELCGKRQLDARKTFSNVQRIWCDLVDTCSDNNTRPIDMSGEDVRLIHDSLLIIESIIASAGKHALRDALLNVRTSIPSTAGLVDVIEGYLLEESAPVRNPILAHLTMA